MFTKSLYSRKLDWSFSKLLLSPLSFIWLCQTLNFTLEPWAHNPQVVSYSALVNSCYSGISFKRVLLLKHSHFNKPHIGLISYEEFRTLAWSSCKRISFYLYMHLGGAILFQLFANYRITDIFMTLLFWTYKWSIIKCCFPMKWSSVRRCFAITVYYKPLCSSLSWFNRYLISKQ